MELPLLVLGRSQQVVNIYDRLMTFPFHIINHVTLLLYLPVWIYKKEGAKNLLTNK